MKNYTFKEKVDFLFERETEKKEEEKYWWVEFIIFLVIVGLVSWLNIAIAD